MDRRRKPQKVEPQGKRRLVRKSAKDSGGKVRDLEKHLAEALKLKTEALEQLQTRDRELAEARQQQTARGEVLRAIATWPVELAPVLAAVIANAVRLVGAKSGHLRQYDEGFLRITAPYNESPTRIAALQANPVRPTSESAVGRAFLERRVVHIPDVQADIGYRGPAVQRGQRAVPCSRFPCYETARR